MQFSPGGGKNNHLPGACLNNRFRDLRSPLCGKSVKHVLRKVFFRHAFGLHPDRNESFGLRDNFYFAANSFSFH